MMAKESTSLRLKTAEDNVRQAISKRSEHAVIAECRNLVQELEQVCASGQHPDALARVTKLILRAQQCCRSLDARSSMMNIIQELPQCQQNT